LRAWLWQFVAQFVAWLIFQLLRVLTWALQAPRVHISGPGQGNSKVADFQLTQGLAAPFKATVTKAGDPTTEVAVDSISWVGDGGSVTPEGPVDGLEVQARGGVLGVGSLTFSARRVSDSLMITKIVTVEVVTSTTPEPPPVVTITKGTEF
jgi:hypothetical protein